jgi:AbrB family looped-hinge helix DNA binding protein
MEAAGFALRSLSLFKKFLSLLTTVRLLFASIRFYPFQGKILASAHEPSRESSNSKMKVRKVNLSYSPNRTEATGLQVKVARRYQVTIPEEVREKARISVGDDVDVRYEDGKILLEKLEDNWEKVMKETEGSWARHPVFGKMKNSVEIVHWLRSQR